MSLGWNPFSDDVKKIPRDLWPIYYRVYNFTMLQTYNKIHRPQAELIASIVNPEVYKSYYEVKKKEEEVKLSGGPQSYTVTDGSVVKSAAKSDTYFDPERGLVDYSGKVLISADEYLKRVNNTSNEGGLVISL